MFAFYVAEFDTFGSPLVQRETSLNSRLRTCQKTPELDLKKWGLCMYAAHLCDAAPNAGGDLRFAGAVGGVEDLTCASSQFNFSLQKGASLKHHFLDSLCSTGIIGVFKAPKSSNSDHFREKKWLFRQPESCILKSFKKSNFSTAIMTIIWTPLSL